MVEGPFGDSQARNQALYGGVFVTQVDEEFVSYIEKGFFSGVEICFCLGHGITLHTDRRYVKKLLESALLFQIFRLPWQELNRRKLFNPKLPC